MYCFECVKEILINLLQGCQPPRLQILRIDGEGMIDDVIMQGTLRHLWKKKTREKDVVGIVTFDRIGLLPTNHIIAWLYYNGIPEFLRKRSMFGSSNNAKYLKFHLQKVESTRNGKLRRLSERFHSNLETRRHGSKSGVSRISRESRQPCSWNNGYCTRKMRSSVVYYE